MPRAGGSYVYASRGLIPTSDSSHRSPSGSRCAWRSASSLTCWCPSSATSPSPSDWTAVAATLERGRVRLAIALGVLWIAAAINLRGVALYERLIVPLMFLTFILGGVVIVGGIRLRPRRLRRGVARARWSHRAGAGECADCSAATFLPAAALLFASFIGFDSIAQAGGEARNPGRNLPLAIGLAVGSVGVFYMLFTAAVYHAVPWQYIAAEAAATRPDRPRSARLSAATVLDGGHRVGRGRGAGQGSAGDAARRCRG